MDSCNSKSKIHNIYLTIVLIILMLIHVLSGPGLHFMSFTGFRAGSHASMHQTNYYVF